MTEKRLPQEDRPGHPAPETLDRRRELRRAPPLALALTGRFRLPGSGWRGTREGGAKGRTPARAAWGGRVPGGGAGSEPGPKGRGEAVALWLLNRSPRRASSAGAEDGRVGRPSAPSLAPGCRGEEAGEAGLQFPRPTVPRCPLGAAVSAWKAGGTDPRSARGCCRNPPGINKLRWLEAYDLRRPVQLGSLSPKVPAVSPPGAATIS